MLSLPFVFVLSGWVAGLVLLLVGATAAIWSNILIATMATENKLKNLDDVAFASGGPCLRKTLQILMIVYVFGSCIGYQIFLG